VSSTHSNDLPDDFAGRRVIDLTGLLETPRFELIPVSNVLDSVEHLPAGAKVSVTASPTRGIESTITLASTLADLGFDVAPHLAARMIRDRIHLEDIVETLAAKHIEHAFVIAGDADHSGVYFDSVDLLRDLETINHSLKQIGIGGYPEGHPTISNSDLMAALKAKQPYASYVTTQMCFDPGAIRAWIESIRGSGVDLPIRIGVPGVARIRKLISISAKIGVGSSIRFLAKSGDLPRTLMRPGGYEPDTLVHELVPGAADSVLRIEGLHIYTFNDVENTERWRKRMLDETRATTESARSRERG